jgi:hypothetical protein
MRQRQVDSAIEHEAEREHETREEQRFTSGDLTGFESDERAAETVTFHDETIEDAERFAEDDEGR